MNIPVKTSRPHLSGDEIAWAYVVGGGLILIMLALGIKAAQGNDPTSTLSILQYIGVFFVIGGGLGWALEFRPWTKFDDLTTPFYTGHAHDDHAAGHAADPAAEHEGTATAEHGGLPKFTAEPPLIPPLTH